MNTFKIGLKYTQNRNKGGNRKQESNRHGLMLLQLTDLMNVTEEVTIHRPNVWTLLSSAFIRGDLNAAARGPFI